ncbi:MULTISPECIES: TPM domain-containing protein [Psychrobacter]|uniref:TLP18.3/Psb32/MOLO-1 phosphatase superfamily protein n=1 Tax=Psychrobacter fozii TaxID=198480 RepID=A0A2V4V6M3_9GAMM|nr:MULTISPECIES: TPM domain-containing protein [Psychrobacter]MBH0066056.1 TPM domain-containing protein [Psychrobacter sp. SZ93C1]PYE38088.1 TLP18.3/Psb32/MOLO-1 phosphatase superfamily protein [Psychrobacter fozii]
MAENNTSNPSFARWWRQVLFVPLLHSKWLTEEAKARLTEKVTQAERGHRGEVFLIVENHLPIQDAYHVGCRARAIDLFSEYRVWDTEENTGVLIYVNVCEHQLEIVADRGISAHVSPTVWRAMCDKAVSGIANQKTEESLAELLDEVGQVMRQYYHLEHDPAGNELSDTVVFLK